MNSSKIGQIITFYSYKGGTGRTMALANIACLLGKRAFGQDPNRPLRILALDWDLEAPGLHRYFRPYLDQTAQQDFDNTPGCLEVFQILGERRDVLSRSDFEANRAGVQALLGEVDFDGYLVPTQIPGLQFMKTGRLDRKSVV